MKELMVGALFASLMLVVAGCGDTADGDDDDSGVGDDDVADDDDIQDVLDQWVLGEVIDTEGMGVLATMDSPWNETLWLMRVQGTHYEMGYQYGRLFGSQIIDLWWTYMGTLGAEMGAEDAETADLILGGVLDLAWEYFEPNIPASFAEEFEGVAAGMEAAGVEYGDGSEDLAKIPIRIVTLLDLAMSSQLDFENISGFFSFLQNGYTDSLLEYYGVEAEAAGEPYPEDVAPLAAALERWALNQGEERFKGPFLNCSYFAAWGDRTVDGGLYMTRDMDFESDTGMNKHGSVVAFVPDDGVAHASISWIGANFGALAGVSAEGIAVSAVGASSPYERAATEPQVLKAREVLMTATDLDSAMMFMSGDVGDGVMRAPTIGYNGLVSWGDPRGGGVGAESAILETNGLEIGVYHHRSDCSVEERLVRYTYEGDVDYEWTRSDHPEWVNREADALEIDGDGNVRYFQHDGNDYVLDGSGDYIEVGGPGEGMPIQNGYPEECALYRGDEAMMYAVRVHQTAANGPALGDTDVMVDSGSWSERYWPMRQMTLAYESGTSYEWEGEEVVADNGGQQVLIGLDEAEQVSRVAAMGSNVYDVVYDTTNLVIRVSYESGSGDTWLPASEQPPFLEIDLNDLFLVE